MVKRSKVSKAISAIVQHHPLAQPEQNRRRQRIGAFVDDELGYLTAHIRRDYLVRVIGALVDAEVAAELARLKTCEWGYTDGPEGVVSSGCEERARRAALKEQAT